MELKKFHKIVLASASPRRLELLRQIGIEPEVKVSHVEEKVTSSIPGDVVMELAAQKAMDVASGEPEGTVTRYPFLGSLTRYSQKNSDEPLIIG